MNIFCKSSSLLTLIKYYASKMQASSTQNNRDSAGRRLGLKVHGDQAVMPGDIIARQRGFKWQPGDNVIVGRDQTIHAKCEGIVRFRSSIYRKIPFYFIDVEPVELPNRKFKHPAPYMYHPELFPERSINNHPTLEMIDKRRVSIKKE